MTRVRIAVGVLVVAGVVASVRVARRRVATESAPAPASATPALAKPVATTPVGASASARADHRRASPRLRGPRGEGAPDPAADTAVADEAAAAALIAEQRHRDAERDDTPEAWDAAADAHALAAAACGPAPACLEHTYAELLARNRAVLSGEPLPEGDAPVPLPPRVEAMIEAMDRYLELAPPSEEATGVRFLAANTRWRYRHLDDDTIARLELLAFAPEVVDVTEYSINLLLDSYLRTDRIADLRRALDRLLADPARLARFPDLVERLHELRARAPG